MTPLEKAEELVQYFEGFTPPKLSDYSRIYSPTAKMFAKKVCEEVLGHMGADRGYEWWCSVMEEIDNLSNEIIELPNVDNEYCDCEPQAYYQWEMEENKCNKCKKKIYTEEYIQSLKQAK